MDSNAITNQVITAVISGSVGILLKTLWDAAGRWASNQQARETLKTTVRRNREIIASALALAFNLWALLSLMLKPSLPTRFDVFGIVGSILGCLLFSGIIAFELALRRHQKPWRD
ncbi:MAG TPA: hypothetical protein VN577_20030 [Terriglobales bacterium]|nr:hypothetical protein [Clostridia bacterium]HWR17129.1 hypothetical protein [Terriglobales bacterium]